MTLDPGQPTHETDLENLREIGLVTGCLLVGLAVTLTLGITDALALAIAVGILACRPKPLEPPT